MRALSKEPVLPTPCRQLMMRSFGGWVPSVDVLSVLRLLTPVTECRAESDPVRERRDFVFDMSDAVSQSR